MFHGTGGAPPVSKTPSLGLFLRRKSSSPEVMHARSRAPDEALRLVARGAGFVVLAPAGPSIRMPWPKRIGQEHNGKDAHRAVAADTRCGAIRRTQHSKQPRRLPEESGLCSRGAKPVSLFDRLGISRADWNSARNGLLEHAEKNRFPAGIVLSASSEARQHWFLLEGHAPAHSVDRRNHGRS